MANNHRYYLRPITCDHTDYAEQTFGMSLRPKSIQQRIIDGAVYKGLRTPGPKQIKKIIDSEIRKINHDVEKRGYITKEEAEFLNMKNKDDLHALVEDWISRQIEEAC